MASLGPESFLLRARQNVSGQLLVACAGKQLGKQPSTRGDRMTTKSDTSVKTNSVE